MTSTVLLGSMVLLPLGCDSKRPDGAPAASSTAAPAPASTIREPSDVLTMFEQAGAQVSRSSTGQASQLVFRDKPITDQLAAELSKLTGPQTLVINSSEMTLKGWEAIGQLKSLRQLDLRDCQLGDAQFKAAVSGLSELVSVRLSGKNNQTTVSDEGIVALANCPKLKVLAADLLFISEEGLAELAKLTQLKELYLAGSLVDDAALERIGAMASITKLRIAKTSVSKSGLEKLAGLKLEELDISECSSVDDAALEPVGKLVTLKKLNLWRDAIGDSGVAWLEGLINLEWLNVDNTQLTDAGLKSFHRLGKLTFLHLGSTAVSDAGMVDLLPLKSLTELKVTRTSVTEEGIKPLQAAMPKLDIQLKYGEP